MTAPARLVRCTHPSPVGVLTLVASDSGLRAVLWEDDRAGRVPLEMSVPDPDHPVLDQARRELDGYFAGQRQGFSVSCDAIGTPFQKRVWAELACIPYGATTTYGAIAQALGDGKAVRAVGAANGRNPLSIVVPCHRVIGASGDLTGFAGGLKTKLKLLHLEGWRPVHPTKNATQADLFAAG